LTVANLTEKLALGDKKNKIEKLSHALGYKFEDLFED
jgi:hypothetical protein